MSTMKHEGARAAEAPAPEVALALTCPNCGRTIEQADAVCLEHSEPWETIDQAVVDADMAEFGIAPGMVHDLNVRVTRVEVIGCQACKPPEPVIVH
jgi:hypothetical protein